MRLTKSFELSKSVPKVYVLIRLALTDYYGLLGFCESESLNLSDEDFRKAFRVVSLLCHPDKASIIDREKAEERFKAIQKAFETLTDSYKRKAYDSSLPFDDSIGTDAPNDLDWPSFSTIFGPIFKRNEKFSISTPCPQLGDENSSHNVVDRFYNFWFSFRSWRDFAYLHENNIDTATSREEKRAMMRENDKKQSVRKKEEIARIYKLAENAYKRDPRIVKRKAEEEAEKLRRKKEKLERLRKEKEEAQKISQEPEAIQKNTVDVAAEE